MNWRLVLRICVNLLKFGFDTLPKCDVLTVANDSHRSIYIDGRAYSPIIDTIELSLEEKGLKCISVARLLSKIKGGKAFGRVYSPEGAFARALLTKKLKAVFYRNRYAFSHYEKRIWIKILKNTSAKVVLGIMPSRELCEACHDLGVYVADIQHGVITRNHPWYSPASRINEPAKWLPTEFLVWDKDTADTLNGWVRNNGSKAVVFGHPWLNVFKDNNPHPIREKLESKYSIKSRKRIGLLSISWGVEKLIRVHEGNDSNGFIPKAVQETIIETQDEIDWLIRLHPIQIQGAASHELHRFEAYFDSTYSGESVEWKIASEIPLPLMLSKVDFHISWSSSVCIEAAKFGIRSIIYSPDLLPDGSHPEYYENLMKVGYVDKLRLDKNLIVDWVRSSASVFLPPLDTHKFEYQKKIQQLANQINSLSNLN